jgi:hypothetical protein
MKLERLEILNLISTKNIIVNEVLKGLAKQFYYNKYELEINLSLVLFTLLGNTELHKEMDREDIDWVSFVNENYSLIEELKAGEYAEVYNDIFAEIQEGAKRKAKYSLSAASALEEIGNALTPENIEKIKATINQAKE